MKLKSIGARVVTSNTHTVADSGLFATGRAGLMIETVKALRDA